MPEAVREFSSVAYDPSDTTTGSPKSSRLAARWLQICVAEHPTCTSYCGSDLPPLPTRVIDVGTKGSTEGRLLISRGRRALYVALSHCWGSSPIFTMTSKNIAELQTKVQFSDLPLTFQHAIEVTRDLGVHYIWIDSLCIIQDSAEDWDIESSRMRDVYRNSICTIAAARAKDGSGAHSRPQTINLPGKNTQQLTLSGDFGPWWLTMKSNALQKGWERLPEHPLLRSCGSLSALAEQMADLLDDEYLAGLWKGDIVRGLLWCCTGKSGTRSKAPEKYVAPSWSWASVRGAVIAADFARGFRRGLVVNDYVFPDQFRSVGPLGDMTQNRWDELVDMYNPYPPLEPEAHYDESDDFSLISANCVKDGHNSFGRVKNGQLRVTGWIKLAKTASRREEDGQDGHPEGGMDLLDPESGAVFGGLNYDEDQGRPYGCTIWCLFLMWRVGREGEGGTGLALLPTGLEEDEFRRIGLAGINERDWTRGRKKMTITIV
ncbi:hypothetical protein BHE90_002251 [Fusarium euwallaceae]|uniref:Heterokaryon incompatibility domain-containing protein n=1 Tax=Fusarium euwallaceae TaxID=1147111 RepID=A0A430M5A2_9HYPO|nr:hypothetical protein BHE90_002251 [Fusarium euwallaceae]